MPGDSRVAKNVTLLLISQVKYSRPPKGGRLGRFWPHGQSKYRGCGADSAINAQSTALVNQRDRSEQISSRFDGVRVRCSVSSLSLRGRDTEGSRANPGLSVGFIRVVLFPRFPRGNCFLRACSRSLRSSCRRLGCGNNFLPSVGTWRLCTLSNTSAAHLQGADSRTCTWLPHAETLRPLFLFGIPWSWCSLFLDEPIWDTF